MRGLGARLGLALCYAVLLGQPLGQQPVALGLGLPVADGLRLARTHEG